MRSGVTVLLNSAPEHGEMESEVSSVFSDYFAPAIISIFMLVMTTRRVQDQSKRTIPLLLLSRYTTGKHASPVFC